jgi:glutamate carboxypeptidase
MQTDLARSHLEASLPRYLDFLQEMVLTNSFTGNPEGVNALGEITARGFAPLGFTAARVPSSNPELGDHLILTRPGNGSQTVGMVSHLDTVFPAQEELANEFRWRVEGDRIYGPGTVDIKGGTVIIRMLLEAIQLAAPEVYADTNWVILLNASEERLSTDFGELCRARLSGAAACLVFEGGFYGHDAARFTLVRARKGMARCRVRVEGVASHAGAAHRAGANAIRQLARLIEQIESFTDYGRELTYNVGVVSGGTVVNRVPHHAAAEVEMRAFDKGVFEAGIAQMLALAGDGAVRNADGFGCKIQVDLLDTTPPWPPNAGTDRLLETWRAAGQTLGMEVVSEARGGLSDGNLTWEFVPTLDALGPGGGGAHQSVHDPANGMEQEYCFVPSFVPKALLNAAAIVRLLGGG